MPAPTQEQDRHPANKAHQDGQHATTTNVNNSTPASEWIHLNVGGKLFQTTKGTLTGSYPDSIFPNLLKDDTPNNKDESGAYLIDADPEHFRTVLNYLRRSDITLGGVSKMTLGELFREATFYKIDPLADKIKKAMSATDPLDAISKKISDINSAVRGNVYNRVGIGLSYTIWELLERRLK